jgi:hypothetical protein
MGNREPNEPWLQIGVWSATTGWRLPSWPESGYGQVGAACEAFAINDLGWVAGHCDTEQGARVFLWESLEPALIPLPDRIAHASVVDVNRTGAMAGHVRLRSDPTGDWVPAYWSPEGGWTVIPVPAGFSRGQPGTQALALNDRGDVLLRVSTPGGFTSGFTRGMVWSRKRGIVFLDGGSWGDRTYGADITYEGFIVGCVIGSEKSRPATWRLPG